uniref:Olduvai domain-containing protein n=1 Tax=Chelonoidis abingdonii TaxID=106734 RepID=A0A8C0GLV6_CHEAB
MEACPAGSWQQLVEPRVGPSGQLVQCQQRNQELQDKLAVSEATVRAQAEQLEQYRTLLSEKYDSLIQAQARELSHLRQKMREGRSVCHLLTQHLRDTVKSFEELLRGTDIDYYMGQSFREHLAQGGQLAERLSSKLSSSAWLSNMPIWGHQWLTELSKELREKERMIETLQAKLQECCETPSSSRALSESPRSNSSASFLSDGPEACSDGDASSEYSHLSVTSSLCSRPAPRAAGDRGQPMEGSGGHAQEASCPPGLLPAEPWCPTQLSVHPAGAGADLLEGHLAEIRSLRQRLEESICINDRLREQLEKRLVTTAKVTPSLHVSHRLGAPHPAPQPHADVAGHQAHRAAFLCPSESPC